MKSSLFVGFLNTEPFTAKTFREIIKRNICSSLHINNLSRIEDNLSRILGEIFVDSFARVIGPFFLFLYPVYLNFYVTNLSGQQRDLKLYVESEPHRGLKFCHQKYNPLTRGARRAHHAPPSAFIGTNFFFFIMYLVNF